MNALQCPDHETLLAYTAGKLGEEISEAIAEHLNACPQCQALLATLDDVEDTLVAKLRQAPPSDQLEQEPELQEAVALGKSLFGPPNRRTAPTQEAQAVAPRDLGQLGEYQLLEKLGEGGMGAVYKALHTNLRRVVALKVLPKDRQQNDLAIARFYREMAAIGQLNHPHIVQAYDARQIEGCPVLVMEYVEGLDLAHLAQRCLPLPVADACELVRQAALGLQCAHEHGLVHRDIKPSNLIVNNRGQLKILDLGLALLHTPEAEGLDLTGSGQVMGTADYMAPEQALASHAVDIRSDVYSLGCTLYKLLTGHAPFGGPLHDTAMKKMMAHMQEPVPPIASRRHDVPQELAAVLERMLAKEPLQRFATPVEVATALAPFARGADLTALLNRARAANSPSRADPGTAITDPWRSSAYSGTKSGDEVGPRKAEAGAEKAEVGLRVFGSRRRVRNAVLVALGFVVFAIVLGVVVIVRNWQGKELARVTARDGSQIAVDADGDMTVTLPEDDGRAASRPAAGDGAGVKAVASPFLGPDGNWRLPADAPPPAIAPFDAKKAKEHQQAWAKHLGVPVEETNSIGMPLMFIPPGEFDMGSTPEEQAWAIKAAQNVQDVQRAERYAERVSSEGPRHRVRITKPFYLATYQVTQGEYEKVMGVNPSAFTDKQVDASKFNPPLSETSGIYRLEDRKMVAGKDTGRHPVETVNWPDAMEFCRRLSATPAERAARRVYRLPTEAEWEYACRAGTARRWSSGDDEAGLVDVGWLNKDAGIMTHPVGGKNPNAWGLYDMYGNVYQWCADWFSSDYYQRSPTSDPSGPPAGYRRMVRGGSWQSDAFDCRSAHRPSFNSTNRSHSYGFRVAVDVVAKEQVGNQPATPAAPSSAGGSKAPPLAKPTMIATEAAQIQKQWAEYLGVAVEKTNSIGMPLVFIPPGEFDMGSTPEEQAWAMEAEPPNIRDTEAYTTSVSSEGPRHRVKITKPFYLGMYPVTQAEYEKVMGVNPSAFTGKQMDASTFTLPLEQKQLEEREKNGTKVWGRDTGRHPVDTVSWNDATEFCRRLSAMSAERAARRVYRLPTEAEWEYACRAGTSTRWYCGDDKAGLDDVAWLLQNANGTTHAVGEKMSNAWGLYDMHGNVYQLCVDRFGADYYEQSPPDNPNGPPAGYFRILRGGSWHSAPDLCRSAYRATTAPPYRRCYDGFRVVEGL